MFANERYDIILSMLKTQRSVTVSDLMERFGVSIETVRRDLAELERRGALERVHGGAVASRDGMRGLNPLSERMTENQELKRELSLKAAELIKEGDVIAVDAGSTAVEFVRVLCEKFERLTIVTYSRDVMDGIDGREGFRLVMTGGDYMPSERVFCGFLTVESLKKLHVTKSFIFPSAVSSKYGVTINKSEFYELQRALMSIADHSYMLADSTKFEGASPVRVCGIDEVDAIVTDSGLDDMTLQLYSDKQATVVK